MQKCALNAVLLKMKIMKKNILIYGVISGLIAASLMLFNMSYLSHCEGKVDFDTSMVIGYAGMLIAFSLVFIGIRNYRNNYNNGLISFGKAFKIGILIVLIASTFYVVAWMIDFFYFNPDFMDKYSAHMLDKLKASGSPQAEIDKEAKDMADFAVLYKNPLVNAGMTYLEILPVGLVVTLISALILKRKTKQENY